MTNFHKSWAMTIESYLPVKKYDADVATTWQIFFQDPATNEMEAIIDLYNNIFFVLLLIFGLVLWLLNRVTSQFHHFANHFSRNLPYEMIVEVLWTLIPMCIIGLIILPNFKLLYLQAKMVDSGLTLKVTGNQWYWQYELYSTEAMLQELEAYMIKEYELGDGKLRLLETTTEIALPLQQNILLLVTSNDVIHSWAIPAFGIKIDAIDGRLTQHGLLIKRPGTYYGQCSEICGAFHAFMPIVVQC